MWAKSHDLKFKFINFNVAYVESGGVSETELVKRVWESYLSAIRYYKQHKVHLFYAKKLIWAFNEQIFGGKNL